jgi:hypothetical protein
VSFDRYSNDVLGNGSPRAHKPKPVREFPADRGVVVEEITTGWVGAVVRVEKSGGMHVVVLEDRNGRTRTFRLGPGFWVNGQPVILTPPRKAAPTASGPSRTASGSVSAGPHKARVARGSRIWVEGKHDAELVEKVWGDDLRYEGVVVELLEGVDNLEEALEEFDPEPGRKVGVLVDHLVSGSKESRIARAVINRFGSENVKILGHPYVDVWEAVKPARVGLDAWPTIDRRVEWKVGVLAHLGWPHSTQADVAQGWQRILGTVRSYTDLEPALLGRVEELIDFVTAP